MQNMLELEYFANFYFINFSQTLTYPRHPISNNFKQHPSTSTADTISQQNHQAPQF